MSIALKTNRRWLKSAILAAQSEEILLPWAAKRISRPAPIHPAPIHPAPLHPAPAQPAPVIRIFPSAPAKYAAIAAR
jgi:hypothetical protein